MRKSWIFLLSFIPNPLIDQLNYNRQIQLKVITLAFYLLYFLQAHGHPGLFLYPQILIALLDSLIPPQPCARCNVETWVG